LNGGRCGGHFSEDPEMAKTYVLKLTSALVIEGVICRAGELVEVSEVEAKNFLGRGKAELATADDGVDQEDDGGESDELAKLTKDKLLAVASERGISIGSGASKAQIIEAILAATAKDSEQDGE
jgi:hypothetical protein